MAIISQSYNTTLIIGHYNDGGTFKGDDDDAVPGCCQGLLSTAYPSHTPAATRTNECEAGAI